MARRRRNQRSPNAPYMHPDHKRPVTRREFLAQGFLTGGAFVMMPTLLNLYSPSAFAAVADSVCGIGGAAGGIPVVCFDLSGGANMAGSNVMVGGPGGQQDFISNAGYNKLGLPDGMIPSVTGVNTELGLAFHPDSAFLRGILSKTSTGTRQFVNGAVMPAQSNNDTSNNPHNPMYGIVKAGSKGQLLNLIGTVNSDSGGNSMAPATLIDLTERPTKISSPNDSRGLVNTGQLGDMMPYAGEAGSVMDAVHSISYERIANATDALDNTTKVTPDKTLQDLVDCGYRKSTYTVQNFSNQDAFDATKDPDIVDQTGTDTRPDFPFTNQSTVAEVDVGLAGAPIFTSAELATGTFTKTASVMKLVANGLAVAGTVQMGGYDYHTSDRSTGEKKDFNAGQAIGAVLEYAARKNTPIVVYVFTDGSLASNGAIDNSGDGRGKGVWSGDNGSTSASFFLVYAPGKPGGPTLLGANATEQAQHQQLGHYRDNGSVETTATTPGANNVNQLVNMFLLNYMALSGKQGQFAATFPDQGLGQDAASLDKLTAFAPIV